MLSLAFLIDFGSTFTKVVAVDLDRSLVVGRSQAPSTVHTDVREGLLQALSVLHERYSLFAIHPRDLEVLSGQPRSCFEQRRGRLAYGGRRHRTWFDASCGQPSRPGSRRKDCRLDCISS